MEATTLATALTNLGTVISNVLTTVEGNTILMTMFIVPLFGAGIGLIKRLKH